MAIKTKISDLCGSLATKSGKPCKQKKPCRFPSHKIELLSITALSRKFNLHRATVRERLVDIKPDKITNTEKLYNLEDVEVLLSSEEKNAVQIRKLQAEADLKEHQLAVQRGEYASAKEFADITQRIFGKLRKKLAVQLPRKSAKKIHKANSSSEVEEILITEIGKEFDNLRNDFRKYL